MQNKMVSLLYWADKFTHTHKELHEVVSISTSCCYDNTSSVHPGRRQGDPCCAHIQPCQTWTSALSMKDVLHPNSNIAKSLSDVEAELQGYRGEISETGLSVSCQLTQLYLNLGSFIACWKKYNYHNLSSQLSSTVKNSNFIILLSQINRGQNVYSFPRKENFGGVTTEEDLDTLTHFATDHHKVETCEPRLILHDQQNNGLEEEVDPPLPAAAGQVRRPAPSVSSPASTSGSHTAPAADPAHCSCHYVRKKKNNSVLRKVTLNSLQTTHLQDLLCKCEVTGNASSLQEWLWQDPGDPHAIPGQVTICRGEHDVGSRLSGQSHKCPGYSQKSLVIPGLPRQSSD